MEHPEATTDGSATDRYLAEFSKKKSKASKPTNVPIHLKVTTSGGKVENIEQVSDKQTSGKTIQLPPISIPQTEDGHH